MINTFKTAVLFAALIAVFVAIGYLFDGTDGMLVAFVLACVLNVGAYWFSGSLALRMAGAHEVSPGEAPELCAVVQELALSDGLPTPRVTIIDDPSPNAFATGRDPAHAVVAVTSGILGLLDREELKGVLAHELSHMRNQDILIASVAATLAGAITLLVQLGRWAVVLGGGGTSGSRNRGSGNAIALLLMVILAPIAATPAWTRRVTAEPGYRPFGPRSSDLRRLLRPNQPLAAAAAVAGPVRCRSVRATAPETAQVLPRVYPEQPAALPGQLMVKVRRRALRWRRPR